MSGKKSAGKKSLLFCATKNTPPYKNNKINKRIKKRS